MATRRPRFPWRYLALAYGLAWVLWIPIALTGQDYQASPLLVALVMVGVFGPGIAGIVLTYVEGSTSAGRAFWQSALDPRRIRPLWYAVFLLLFPTLGALAAGIYMLLGGTPPTFAFIREYAAQPLGLLVVAVLYFLQAWLEELGWRGYMQDRVQALRGPLGASLVIGICHALWHLPLFLVEGTNQKAYGFGPDLWLFIATALAGAVYATWCYNANRRSTLAATLLHFSVNLSLDTFTEPGPRTRIFQVLTVCGALVICVVWALRRGAPAQVDSGEAVSRATSPS